MLGLAATWPTIEVGLASGAPAVPTLFVSGAADQIVPVDMVRRVAGRLPDARLATFPGDLHDVLNEHDRDAVYQAVAAFLAETVVGQPVA
ncbi:MAG: alpha/beta hydrolase [Actinomycetes bacterium]